MNQQHCVINDRDEDLWVDVEARIRCLLFTMMQSEKWIGYLTPGYPTIDKVLWQRLLRLVQVRAWPGQGWSAHRVPAGQHPDPVERVRLRCA